MRRQHEDAARCMRERLVGSTLGPTRPGEGTTHEDKSKSTFSRAQCVTPRPPEGLPQWPGGQRADSKGPVMVASSRALVQVDVYGLAKA
jgi:hypothetical protein